VCGPGPSARRTNAYPTGFQSDTPNPAPLSRRQLRVLLAAAVRELSWGLPAVAREVRHWRTLAERIPDAPIREDALGALHRKRGQSDGAALFTILPRVRSAPLLRLLVAYQLIWDYLDSVHERSPDESNGRQLHLALIDALQPGTERRDYYRHHPWQDDGGYLNALVDACRECCLELPGYEQVRPLVVREARRAEVLALNHHVDPALRNTRLEAWSRQEFPAGHEARWFELSGACSAGLTIFALLALATEPIYAAAAIEQTHSTYLPWISVVATMLDSYVDLNEDAESGDHIYVAHYASPTLATERVCWLLQRSVREASRLRAGEKHILIVASMAALYLSKDSARTAATRESTRLLAAAGGSLTRVLVPILRLWRTVYALRSS
jgi:tetraprenyl-beta-curcumene synthase